VVRGKIRMRITAIARLNVELRSNLLGIAGCIQFSIASEVQLTHTATPHNVAESRTKKHYLQVNNSCIQIDESAHTLR
jgi:hypothetical protein